MRGGVLFVLVGDGEHRDDRDQDGIETEQNGAKQENQEDHGEAGDDLFDGQVLQELFFSCGCSVCVCYIAERWGGGRRAKDVRNALIYCESE